MRQRNRIKVEFYPVSSVDYPRSWLALRASNGVISTTPKPRRGERWPSVPGYHRPREIARRHWEGYEKTMQTGETRYGAGDFLTVPAIRKDGRRISTEFMIVPFRDEAGRMHGIAAIMRDVTKPFEEMRALRKAASAAP
ncbi:MAG TPA: hypothetical protein DDZ81_21205 [Acetobacteraceae bacterium]|nr:hypothetical protein [Acetobacteraceae bacterium]